MQNEFGPAWKEEVAKFITWRGLEKTENFHDWYESSGYITGLDSENNITYPAMSTTIGNIKLLGNSNCR